jgi:hypothetical protein
MSITIGDVPAGKDKVSVLVMSEWIGKEDIELTIASYHKEAKETLVGSYSMLPHLAC